MDFALLSAYPAGLSYVHSMYCTSSLSSSLSHAPAVNVSCLDKTQHFQSHFMGAHWPPSGGILSWSSCLGQGLDPESHVEAILFGPLLCCHLLPTKLVLVYGSSWPLEGSKKGFSSRKKNHKSLD